MTTPPVAPPPVRKGASSSPIAYEQNVTVPPKQPLSAWRLLPALGVVLAGAAYLHTRHNPPNNDLQAAARNHDVNQLRELRPSGATTDIHAHDSQGHSPLHLAAQAGDADAVATLLNKGANIEEKDAQGQTALCLASTYHQEKVIELLLAHGADVNALAEAHFERSPDEQSPGTPSSPLRMQQRVIPLLWAAQQGSPALIRAIWDKQMDADMRKTLAYPALMSAVRSGSVEAVKTLLDRGVPVETPMGVEPRQSPLFTATTPLISAASMHNVPLCRLLLDRGANVNRGLDAKSGGNTPLMVAATDSTGELMQLFLERRANVNARNAQGETPLMLACLSSKATQALLVHGANVNARDAKGNTALMHAQNNDVLRLLLKAGADARNTPLDTMLLTRASTPDVTSLLIARGAEVDERDSKGKTALMRTRYDEVIPTLLEHGASINVKDYAGRTALHEAAVRMSPERVQLLLAHGADPNAKSANGETPLSLAKQQRSQPVIDVLVKAGAKQ